MYQPTDSDVQQLIPLLGSGLSGQGASQAQQQLNQYQRSPQFCQLLSHVFSMQQAPCEIMQGFSWMSYRYMAGLTLKNNIEKAYRDLGEDVIKHCAQTAAGILGSSDIANPEFAPLVNAACNIISKITSIAGLPWWQSAIGVDLTNVLVSNFINSQNDSQVKTGLRAFQYLLEDAGDKIGPACETFIHALTQIALNHSNVSLREYAFTVLQHPYDVGMELDWAMDNLPPFQQGLCSAAPHVAQCVSTGFQQFGATNRSIHVSCLKLFGQLSEYLEYLVVENPPNPQGPAMQCINFWITSCVVDIRSRADQECAMSACEFLSGICRQILKDGGDGVPAYIFPFIEQQVPELVNLLFPCMLMSEEHERHVMERDDYQYRDRTAHAKLKRKFTKVEEEDPGELNTSLRDSALILLELLTQVSNQSAYQPLINVIQQNWQNPDWRMQEVAILAFGCAVEGCTNQLSSLMPTLISQLCEIASRQVNPIVTSMALWALMKCFSYMLAVKPDLTTQVLQTGLGLMPVTSRRVQQAAASVVKLLVMQDAAVQYTQPLLEHIFNTVHQCLPVYHSNSLGLLCDIAANAFTLVPNEETLRAMVLPFANQLQGLSTNFMQTAQQRYVNGDTNTDVQKEVFDVARAIAGAYTAWLSPENANNAKQMVLSWIGVVQQVMQWDTSDDEEILYYPLYLVQILCSAMDEATYSTVSEQVVAMALMFIDRDSPEIQGTCCMMIYDGVHFLGPRGIPGPDQVVAKLLPLMHVKDSPELAVEAAGVLLELFSHFPSNTPSMVQAAQLLGKQVRTDTHTSYIPSICLYLGAMLGKNAQLLEAAPLANVITVVARSSNDSQGEKEAATFGIIQAIQAHNTADPSTFQHFLPLFLKLVYSWQSAASENLVGAIASLLQYANAQHSALFQQLVTSTVKDQRYQNQFIKRFGLG